jgi:muramoyltetrapeptide carboxypeptidase
MAQRHNGTMAQRHNPPSPRLRWTKGTTAENETNLVTFTYNNIYMPVKKRQPEFLTPGDEVEIISPAFAIDTEKIESAAGILEEWGLKVHLGRNVLKREGPFAGTDEQRLYDFQKATDNRRIKAVFCSRGGYGMLKIINRIDFSSLKKNPKWFTGFSDITVLHLWLSEMENLVSIHGEMPLNFSDPGKSEHTMESLRGALFGEWKPVTWTGRYLKPAEVSGELTGGNLSLIYSLTGTPGEPKTKGKILFIEEVGEYYYHLDRMLTSMKLAGRLKDLSAMIVGGLNEMKETRIPWNKSPEKIISDIVKDYNYPVFFNFPAGHISDNRAFYIGKKARMELAGKRVKLSYE